MRTTHGLDFRPVTAEAAIVAAMYYPCPLSLQNAAMTISRAFVCRHLRDKLAR